MEPILLLDPKIVIKPWAPDSVHSKLNSVLNKNVPSRTGETWEFCPDSIIITPSLKGRILKDVFFEHGTQYFGTSDIDIMIKFIDAEGLLSLQVHPNDEQALSLENEPNGKTEAWYFIDCDKNSMVINGISPAFKPSDQNSTNFLNNIKRYVNYANVSNNDVMMIPAGTVHAIGAGILLYEVQQCSDITYRLHDWERNDREIHIEKGLQVIKPGSSKIKNIDSYFQGIVIDNDYFTTSIYFVEYDGGFDDLCFSIMVKDYYKVLTVIEGYINIKTEHTDSVAVNLGQTACLTINNIFNISGNGKFLISQIKNV